MSLIIKLLVLFQQVRRILIKSGAKKTSTWERWDDNSNGNSQTQCSFSLNASARASARSASEQAYPQYCLCHPSQSDQYQHEWLSISWQSKDGTKKTLAWEDSNSSAHKNLAWSSNARNSTWSASKQISPSTTSASSSRSSAMKSGKEE